MLEYNDGFLFVGLDGRLYLATFDVADEEFFTGQPWVVSHVRTEWWGAVYPPEGE